MSLKKRLRLSILCTGFTAISLQIIYLRGFFVAFSGNELSVGLILASWLLWVAIGGIAGGWTAYRFNEKTGVLSVAHLVEALALAASYLLIYSCRNIMDLSPGEIAGGMRILASALALLSVPCLLLGFMFSLTCSAYCSYDEKSPGGIGHVYILESLGSLVGGVVLSVFLLHTVEPFQYIIFLILLNAGLFLVLGVHGSSSLFRRILYPAVFVTVSLVSVLCFIKCDDRAFFDSLRWPGMDVVDSENSRYGNITVIRQGEQISFYEDGDLAFSVPDDLSAEEAVHFYMLQCRDPKKVLLVGGGLGGALNEILKYDVRKVDYIELDPEMVDLSRKYLSPEYTRAFERPQVNIVNGDGREYIKRSKEKYDCIIINLGDPLNIRMNRYYTEEFFEDVHRGLYEDGILGFSVTASENYIGGALKTYLSSIFNTLNEVFSYIVVIPGDTMHFIACPIDGILTVSPEKLSKKIEYMGLDTGFIRDYYLDSRMSGERMEYAYKAVSSEPGIGINRDFYPKTYFYALASWESQMNGAGSFGKILSKKTSLLIWALVFIAMMSVLASGRPGNMIYRISVFTTGFSVMIYQVMLIVAFQAIFGYVFYKICVIMTMFMAGMVFGSAFVTGNIGRFVDKIKAFRSVQFFVFVYPVMMMLLITFLSLKESSLILWAGTNIAFPFLAFAGGTAGGMQFPMANELLLDGAREAGKTAGLSYGSDLMGACFGGILFSLLFFPALGMIGVCLLTMALNLAVLLVLSRK